MCAKSVKQRGENVYSEILKNETKARS